MKHGGGCRFLSITEVRRSCPRKSVVLNMDRLWRLWRLWRLHRVCSLMRRTGLFSLRSINALKPPVKPGFLVVRLQKRTTRLSHAEGCANDQTIRRT